jgi:beta-galactosidase
MAETMGAEYFVHLELALPEDTLYAKAGHVIAAEQLALPYQASAAPQVNLDGFADSGNVLKVKEDAQSVAVTGSGFSVEFSRESGALSSLVYNGAQMLENGEGPELNLYRARIDNDNWLGNSIRQGGLDRMTYTVKSVEAEKVLPGLLRVTVVKEAVIQAQPGGIHDGLFHLCGWSHSGFQRSPYQRDFSTAAPRRCFHDA